MDIGILVDPVEFEANVQKTVESIKEASPVMLAHERAYGEPFKVRFAERWEPALDMYEVICLVTRDIWQRSRNIQAAKDLQFEDVMYAITSRLHARAMLVSAEILTLLRGGYPSGAYARWRTLHELYITMALMHQHGPDLAQRFWDHYIIERYANLQQYEKHCEEMGWDHWDEKEIVRLREEREKLVAKYGKDFTNHYGWAAEALGKERPTFEQMEAAVEMSGLRPAYKWASSSIHPYASMLFQELGSLNPRMELTAGPSSRGISQAGHSALVTLLQCTSILIAEVPSIDTGVIYTALLHLLGAAGEAFSTAEDQT